MPAGRSTALPSTAPASLSNTQCTVAGSPATHTCSTLTLALNITFNAASFSGARVIYAAARDVAENNSGWQNRGVVFIPPVTQIYPATVTLTPSQGSGSQQIFTAIYRDAANAANPRHRIENNSVDVGGNHTP